MSWLNKLLPPKIKRNDAGVARKSALPEGLWSKCPSCEAVLYATDLASNCHVCPSAVITNVWTRGRESKCCSMARGVRDRREVLPVDSLNVQGQSSLSGALAGCDRGHRRDRRAGGHAAGR
jgi:acetyl-CoA carboxylase carboxyl transferase subunit beta